MSGPGHDLTSEPGTAATPAAERNLEIASHVRDLYEREGPWGIYERYDEFFCPDAVWKPAVSAFGTEGYVGREGMRKWIEDMEAVATDFTQIIDEVRAAGGGHVLALGSMRIVGKESGLSFEGDYAALWEIDGERLRSMRAFLSHEDAEQAAAALEQAGASGDAADA